jgi:hypothetical protein
MRNVFALLAVLLASPAFALDATPPRPLIDAAAAHPFVVARQGGGFYISVIEKPHALAVYTVGRLSQSESPSIERTGLITGSASLLTNWADFPSLTELPTGDLIAYVPLKHGEAGGHASDAAYARSIDSGRTWSEPVLLNRDGLAAEHAFVSLLPLGRDTFVAAWLDGRRTVEGGPMTLRAARFDKTNREDEIEVDAFTCDCCQTDAARTAKGHVIVYRDRTKDEIRDISITRFERGRYAKPTRVAADNWKMPGCPVNGPAVASQRNRVVVAWPTGAGAAEGQLRVRVAQSLDGGRTFGKPVEVEPNAVGRVDVALLDGGDALVSFVAQQGATSTLQVAQFDGSLRETARVDVSKFDAGRSTGFPRLAVDDALALIVWTSSDGGAPKVEYSVVDAH